MAEKPEVDVDLGWWRGALWLLVLAGAAWFLLNIESTIIAFGVAWLIAYLLNPIVETLEGRRLGPLQQCSRGLAIGIVYLILVGALVAMASLLFPQVSQQVQKLLVLQDVLTDPAQLTAEVQQRVQFLLERVPEQYRQDVYDRATQLVQDSASQVGRWVGQGLQYLAAFIGQLFSGMFLFLTGVIISIYMLQGWRGMGNGFVEMLPLNYQDDARSLSLQMNQIFGGYLQATIITSLACMLATFISILIVDAIFGVSFPFIYLISFVAGITYPIPVLGILASTVLGAVLGFLPENNLAFASTVGATVFIVNNIIDRTVQPKLMSDAIGVSPLFVMFGAFAGGELMGVWGMLLGIPLAAMAKALFVWFHGRFLSEPEVEVVTVEAEGPPHPPPSEETTV